MLLVSDCCTHFFYYFILTINIHISTYDLPMNNNNLEGMKAGVTVNDVITKINNRDIMCNKNSNCVPDFVKTVQNTPIGQSVELDIKRKTLNKIDEKSIHISITPSRSSSTAKGLIGIGVSPNLKSNVVIKPKNNLDAINMGIQETSKQLSSISNGLINAASTGFQGSEISVSSNSRNKCAS